MNHKEMPKTKGGPNGVPTQRHRDNSDMRRWKATTGTLPAHYAYAIATESPENRLHISFDSVPGQEPVPPDALLAHLTEKGFPVWIEEPQDEGEKERHKEAYKLAFRELPSSRPWNPTTGPKTVTTLDTIPASPALMHYLAQNIVTEVDEKTGKHRSKLVELPDHAVNFMERNAEFNSEGKIGIQANVIMVKTKEGEDGGPPTFTQCAVRMAVDLQCAVNADGNTTLPLAARGWNRTYYVAGVTHPDFGTPPPQIMGAAILRVSILAAMKHHKSAFIIDNANVMAPPVVKRVKLTEAVAAVAMDQDHPLWVGYIHTYVWTTHRKAVQLSIGYDGPPDAMPAEHLPAFECAFESAAGRIYFLHDAMHPTERMRESGQYELMKRGVGIRRREARWDSPYEQDAPAENERPAVGETMFTTPTVKGSDFQDKIMEAYDETFTMVRTCPMTAEEKHASVPSTGMW